MQFNKLLYLLLLCRSGWIARNRKVLDFGDGWIVVVEVLLSLGLSGLLNAIVANDFLRIFEQDLGLSCWVEKEGRRFAETLTLDHDGSGSRWSLNRLNWIVAIDPAWLTFDDDLVGSVQKRIASFSRAGLDNVGGDIVLFRISWRLNSTGQDCRIVRACISISVGQNKALPVRVY